MSDNDEIRVGDRFEWSDGKVWTVLSIDGSSCGIRRTDGRTNSKYPLPWFTDQESGWKRLRRESRPDEVSSIWGQCEWHKCGGKAEFVRRDKGGSMFRLCDSHKGEGDRRDYWRQRELCEAGCGFSIYPDEAHICSVAQQLADSETLKSKPDDVPLDIAVAAMQKEEARMAEKARKAYEYFMVEKTIEKPKCAPGCVPSAPCMGSACPAHREAGVMGLMSTHNLDYWSRKLTDACEARQWRSQRWEPLTSGHASLMGRYRVNRR